MEFLENMNKFRDLTGKNFGKWSVISRVEKVNNGKVVYHCECECGRERKVEAQSLRNGRSRSCGCLRSERMLGNKLAAKGA